MGSFQAHPHRISALFGHLLMDMAGGYAFGVLGGRALLQFAPAKILGVFVGHEKPSL